MEFQQIQQLIEQHAIVHHEDGGHSWLQVPHALIKMLGIKPSGFSYRDKVYAYLEEDCDMGLFIRAMKLEGSMQTFWQLCPRSYFDDSPIRKKKHY